MASDRHAAEGIAHRLVGLFTDRKINTKVSIGFAVVLLIMAVVSGMAYLAFGKIAVNFETYRQRNDESGVARDFDREFLSLRRYVREYAAFGEESDIVSAEKGRATVNDIIGRGLATIKSPERLAKMKEIAAQVELYGKDFGTLVTLRRRQIKTANEVLDPTGVKLRTDFDELAMTASLMGDSNLTTLAGQGLEQVMLVRLNVNKLLARHDQAVADAAEKSFVDLNKVISALDAATKGNEARKTFDAIKQRVAAYHEGYGSVSRDSRDTATLVNGEMKNTGDDTANYAQAIKDSGIGEAKVVENESESLIVGTGRFVLILAISGLVIGVIVSWLIGRGISRPIIRMTNAMTGLAGGDLKIEIPARDNADEIGSMANAVQVFKDNMIEAESLRASQEEQKKRAEAERRRAIMDLAGEFEKAVGGIIGNVSSSSTELEAAAATLTRTAATTQELSNTVASASEEASANVQSVASAAEQMAASVTEIGRQVHESSRISSEAVGQAQKTDERMTRLSQSAGRIGDVTQLITTIAEQTNLLALNATIEAARAGEAGRGFAVVAQEVKALASQTARATSEISSQIAEMQSATQESVAAIKEIGGTIGRISEIATTIASAVEQQGAATQEITRNVQQAASAATQVATNITDVNRGAAETGSASSQVLSSAQSLASESNRLKLEMDKFLVTVRAA